MKKLILFSLIVLCSITASAWNNIGHRIVADIAYHNLTKKARKNIDAVSGFRRAIVSTSSWPDEIKSDTIYPESFVWHYQDLDSGKSRADLEYLYNNKLSEGKHLFFAKDSLITVLKSEPKNVDALKFLIHFGGDEFQPMHAGHKSDVAGNRTQMTWFSQRINMHSLWDRYLIAYTGYSSTEYAEYLMDKYAAKRDEYMRMTEVDALWKTYLLVEDVYAYYEKELKPTVDATGALPRGYEYKYAYRFIDPMEEQLYMAGIQLAKVLNEIYG